MELIDIGVNLTNARLYDRREALQQQAVEAGIIHQVITGTCLESSRQALGICNEKPHYYSCTAGFHPHDAKDYQPDHYAQLKALARESSVIAIGECGLDFNRNYSPPEIQIKVFDVQIQLALETSLPLFLHQRDAHQEFLARLKPHSSELRAVCHCFTGSREEMKAYLDMGFYIGITGWVCDERRGHALQEAVRYAPADRLLVETDAPYLQPRTIRPRPKSNLNVPAYLPWVVKAVAELKNVEEQTVAEITTANCRTLFRLND